MQYKRGHGYSDCVDDISQDMARIWWGYDQYVWPGPIS